MCVGSFLPNAWWKKRVGARKTGETVSHNFAEHTERMKVTEGTTRKEESSNKQADCTHYSSSKTKKMNFAVFQCKLILFTSISTACKIFYDDLAQVLTHRHSTFAQLLKYKLINTV